MRGVACYIITMLGDIDNCEECPKKGKCNIFGLVKDLTALRLTCKICGRATREEHVKFCPFCGEKVK